MDVELQCGQGVTCALWFGHLVGSVHRRPPPRSHPLSLLFPRLPRNTWVSRFGHIQTALLFLPVLFHQTSLFPKFLNLIWVKLRLPSVQAPH